MNDSQNDNIRIANNRVLANGGTNLAGGIGIFSGTEGYEVANNDICGNFSAEYGGGISHYGLSPNGKIHHNRVYFNRSYDEGGGIFIAGELPADPNLLTSGAGPVDVYANLIQDNLANDDGGGLRFLMAGNFVYNVYNNIIVNNISTHEGGGVSLNDAPNVRFFNNTVMKNITTATAMTSNGQPAPAGLSSSRNSSLLQATLPGGSPLFSNPLLFNNIFWENRAGTFVGSTVAGIGLAGDPNPVNYWDLGVSDGIGLLTPTNSVLQTELGTVPAGNLLLDPTVVSTYDTTVRALPWRGNPRFVDILMITADATPNLLGDYHIQGSSPARNTGAASKAGVNAPADDFDGQSRPSGGSYDIGADEIPAMTDLSITKTDNLTNVNPGDQIRYTIQVTNAGATAVTGATITDTFPTPNPLNGPISWTCATTGGATCGGGANGNGNINRTVNMPVGSTVTFTTTSGSVASTASGFLTNTANVTAPVGVVDSNLANNSATDTDTILTVSAPALTLLDNFNRANSNNLGANWSQAATGSNVDIRVNNNQAFVNETNNGGRAIWNSSIFGAQQGAAFTFANNNRDGSSLILKASGGTLINPTNFIRVRFETTNGGRIRVATTTSGPGGLTLQGTIPGVSFANGNTLTAMVNSTGMVYVWKTAGATTTLLGSVQLPNNALWTTGTGRIGMQFTNTSVRIDNFSGGTVP